MVTNAALNTIWTFLSTGTFCESCTPSRLCPAPGDITFPRAHRSMASLVHHSGTKSPHSASRLKARGRALTSMDIISHQPRGSLVCLGPWHWRRHPLCEESLEGLKKAVPQCVSSGARSYYFVYQSFSRESVHLPLQTRFFFFVLAAGEGCGAVVPAACNSSSISRSKFLRLLGAKLPNLKFPPVGTWRGKQASLWP